MASHPNPSITLFQLTNTRAIRIAWLLEELAIPYDVVTGDGSTDLSADLGFKAQSGLLGKSPTIHDGPLKIQESGAIAQYLIETYDKSTEKPLLPSIASPGARNKVREFMHLAEGIFLLHAYPAFASKRLPPYLLESKDIQEFRMIATKRVIYDMNWLEQHLAESGSTYLVGEHLTGADIMMGFSVQLILQRILIPANLGDSFGSLNYPLIKKWLGALMGREALKAAMMKTSFTA